MVSHRDVQVRLHLALGGRQPVVTADAHGARPHLVVARAVPVRLDLVRLADPLQIETLGARLRDQDRLDHFAVRVCGRVEGLDDCRARLSRDFARDYCIAEGYGHIGVNRPFFAPFLESDLLKIARERAQATHVDELAVNQYGTGRCICAL